jgi:predicted PurR-regulated permease PerM
MTTASARRPRPPRLRIRARSIAVSALVVGGVFVAAWVLGRATRVLGWVVAASVLAALLIPVVEVLARRIPRGLALAAVLLSVAGLTAFVVWASVGDLQHGLRRLRAVAPQTAADLEARRSWIGDAARQFGLRDRVTTFLDDIPARLAGGNPAQAVRAAASRGIALLITTVLTIFLLSHGPRLVRGLLRQLPEGRREEVSGPLFHGYRRAWGYVVAMVAKAIVVGVVTWAVAGLLGLPAPSVLGVVVGAASVVPRFGVALGGLSLILLTAGLHGPVRVAWAIAAVLALQVADAVVTAHVIEPRTVRVGPAISLAVLLLATNLYGVGGAVVGLVLAVVAVALLSELVPEVSGETDEESVRVLP